MFTFIASPGQSQEQLVTNYIILYIESSQKVWALNCYLPMALKMNPILFISAASSTFLPSNTNAGFFMLA
jgi:hypothetical protein